jgi:hypothetical protein
LLCEKKHDKGLSPKWEDFIVRPWRSEETALTDARLTRLLAAGCPPSRTGVLQEGSFYLHGRERVINCRPSVEDELLNSSPARQTRIVRALLAMSDERDIPSVAHHGSRTLRGERHTILGGVRLFFYTRSGGEIDVYFIDVLRDDGPDDDGGEGLEPLGPYLDPSALAANARLNLLFANIVARMARTRRGSDVAGGGTGTVNGCGGSGMSGDGDHAAGECALPLDLARWIELAYRQMIFVSNPIERNAFATSQDIVNDLCDYDVTVLSTCVIAQDLRLISKVLKRSFDLRYYEYPCEDFSKYLALFSQLRSDPDVCSEVGSIDHDVNLVSRDVIEGHIIPLDIVVTYDRQSGWIARVASSASTLPGERWRMFIGIGSDSAKPDLSNAVLGDVITGQGVTFVMRVNVRRRIQ